MACSAENGGAQGLVRLRTLPRECHGCLCWSLANFLLYAAALLLVLASHVSRVASVARPRHTTRDHDPLVALRPAYSRGGAQAAADPDTIAASFLEVYVNKFANARAELPELYADASVMSFEGKTAGGKEGITAMLAENPVPAGSAAVLTTTDVQPSCAPGALLVFTTADMVGAKVQQVFHLVPTEGGSYYIHNDVFRASGSEANPDNTMVEMGGDVGKAFVLHYIETFDSDKSLLASLYVSDPALCVACIALERTPFPAC